MDTAHLGVSKRIDEQGSSRKVHLPPAACSQLLMENQILADKPRYQTNQIRRVNPLFHTLQTVDLIYSCKDFLFIKFAIKTFLKFQFLSSSNHTSTQLVRTNLDTVGTPQETPWPGNGRRAISAVFLGR
jgi:hypothetical protein